MRQNTEVHGRNVAVPKLLGMLFAKNKHPMYVCDLNTLAFLDVNDAAIRDCGYSRRWFLGATILDIRPTTEIPRLLEQMRAPGANAIAGQNTMKTPNPVAEKPAPSAIRYALEPAIQVPVDEIVHEEHAV